MQLTKIQKSSTTIKAWAESDRPREKLIERGKNALTDAELIATLIGSGTKNETSVELSKRILGNFKNNLGQLGKLNINDFVKFKGIGVAKATSIVAALELGRRRRESEAVYHHQIKGAKDVFELFHPRLADLIHEEFWIILLNRSNKIIVKQRLSVGGLSGTVVDIRIILKMALESLATSIILCHNHPSGSMRPSKEDIALTKKIKNSAEVMDIKVLDHVIVTESGYYSFSDEGMI